MPINPLAGKPAPRDLLIDVNALEKAYFERKPDVSDPLQLVSFGTSGHRGTPLDGTFTQSHILAISEAIAEYRHANGITGPLFIGKDTHAVSGVAQETAVEVFAANGVQVIVQENGGATPTPVISHAILTHNQGRSEGLADGVVITPSHNPPRDGGFKYNPPEGGPADTSVTAWIQHRANDLLREGNRGVNRAFSPRVEGRDYIGPYVDDLASVIDMDAIRSAGLKIGVDPLGGSSLDYWGAIRERFGIDIDVVNPRLDPTFSFMTLDHDGQIRMDCSSPYAMAGLVARAANFDIAWGNDPDADRHGIVTRSGGLLNPNHYLAVVIDYLLRQRPDWPVSAVVGKTLVSSSMIDHVVADLGRNLWEVPVGFKWFAPGLFDASCCFGGEESAGASFLRRNGTVWTTDKDGIILGLLSAEITARTGKDPGECYRALVSRFGEHFYTRIDAPATPEQKSSLAKLSPDCVAAATLAGDRITAKLTKAPGNGEAIGGLKVTTEYGWFAARPSGTENVYKLYAESYKSEEHLDKIIEEAQQIVNNSLEK